MLAGFKASHGLQAHLDAIMLCSHKPQVVVVLVISYLEKSPRGMLSDGLHGRATWNNSQMMNSTRGHGRVVRANAWLTSLKPAELTCLHFLVPGSARPCTHVATRGLWTDTPPEDPGSTFYDSTVEQVSLSS